MIIVNNGSRKTGTVWLQRGLYRLLDVMPLPQQVRDSGMKNDSIAPEHFRMFLADHDAECIYYSKSHFMPDKDFNGLSAAALFADNRIRHINSIRNVGDALVSWYHHMIRLKKTGLPFEAWFPRDGITFAQQYAKHHTGWHTRSDPFLFSFENMKADYAEEMRRCLAWFDLQPVKPLPANFNQDMSIEAEQARRPSPHLRRGIVGEHRDKLSSRMCDEIRNILHQQRFAEIMAPVCERHGIELRRLYPEERMAPRRLDSRLHQLNVSFRRWSRRLGNTGR